jgi:hypothetical protein
LQDARSSSDEDGSSDEYDFGRGGPGLVAAVCVRDHWKDMSVDERDWCLSVICSEVEREGNHWNELVRVQLSTMSPDRACAYVLPLLFEKALAKDQGPRVRQALVIALTHAVDEVRRYAASGIGRYLWAVDRDWVLRCVNALATEATLIQRMVDTEMSRSHEEHRQLDEVEAEAATLVRQWFFEASGIADDAYQAMDSTTWFGTEANERILSILGQAPTDAVAIAGFDRLSYILVGWWDADDHRHQNRHEQRRERNYETESSLSVLLQNFLLRTSVATATTILQPIVDAVDHHPREVQSLLLGLISVEDRQPNTSQFWSLWEMFADKIRRAEWLTRIDDEYASGQDMISALFLGTRWKEEARHWRSLEGYAWHIHSLFEDLPASSTVLDDYIRFLYHVGEQSLPEAFIRVAKRLKRGNPSQMLRKENTIFMLEALLQRYVYGRPLELKRQSDLREAVLLLLDLLVENGSSASFRMRDDFVTPISIT